MQAKSRCITLGYWTCTVFIGLLGIILLLWILNAPESYKNDFKRLLKEIPIHPFNSIIGLASTSIFFGLDLILFYWFVKGFFLRTVEGTLEKIDYKHGSITSGKERDPVLILQINGEKYSVPYGKKLSNVLRPGIQMRLKIGMFDWVAFLKWH